MSAVLTEFRRRVVSDFRKPVLTMVEASWERADGTLQTVFARMEDKSAGGACIRVKTPLMVGSKLRIQWRHEHFSGTVRYCRSEGLEFLAGIQRDATESPISNHPALTDVTPQKSAQSSDPQTSTIGDSTLNGSTINVPTFEVSIVEVTTIKVPMVQVSTAEVAVAEVPPVKIESPPSRQERKPNEVPPLEQKVESAPVVSIASLPTRPLRGVGHEGVDHEGVDRAIDDGDGPRSRAPDLDALLPADPQPELHTELQTNQLPKQAGEGRKHMRDKWLELPWQKKQERLSEGGQGDGDGSNDNGNGKSEKENLMPDPGQPTQKAPVRSAREVPSFQVDLSPMEDIYRAAGILNPRRGYSINKVIEMLHSEHIRELPKEMKQAAVLMALDAAGTPVDQVQKDAKVRQDALDSHEAQQTKQIEAEWARKAEEITQIQAELESIKAHYMARITRNMEGVAREKATFHSWLTLKQQECQSMAEAVDLCLKSHGSEPAIANPSDLSMVQVKAKTV